MKFLLALSLIFSPVEVHKFYVSLTDIAYNEESQRMEVSSKYFIDDMEQVLDLPPGQHITMPMDRNLLPLMSDYLDSRLVILVDGEACPLDLLGYELEDDVVWIYLESKPVEKFRTVEITAKQLTDAFETQQNIVHFEKGGEIKSLFLRKESVQGTLSFD